MLFNSIEFAIFLVIVFLLYWFVINKNLKKQNTLILFVSYVFYGWWDWRFLSLIAVSSFIDFFLGLEIAKTNKKQKRQLLLLGSIFVNIGLLGFFKYFNFFVESFSEAFSFFGKSLELGRLSIILPVGISFYTFQTLSYSIDIYKRKLEPTKDIITFFAFVSFFPQLVAGPIERAKNLLPQFYKARVFDYGKAVDGMRQILWGLFKKMVIADNCARFANEIFGNYGDYSGATLMLGAIFFAFQIYGDFSGYSDIAIGTARLFGFNLMQNFAFPYFSRDIAEFWRRWHISLSTWFRDYLYIPLGGSRVNNWLKIRNIFIIFIVSGFWHGANWTFIVWGLLNAIYFLPLLFFNKNRNHLGIVAEGKLLPTLKEFIGIVLTFGLTTLTWVFFRAENLNHAINYLNKIFSYSFFTYPRLLPKTFIAILVLFIIMEWFQRDKQHALQFSKVKSTTKVLRWSIYLFIVILLATFGVFEKTEFIYFAF